MKTFHTQGAVPLDSLAYIEREFERSVIQSVFSARWVLVLGPRQHGKTTGLIRVNNYLARSGFLSAFVDLQGLIVLCKSYEELLEKFSKKVAERLNLEIREQPREANAKQLIYWFENIFPAGKQPIVIIVDEASAIENDEWRNAFYSQIRAIKNEQAIAKPDDLVNRLRLIFSGCFRPETLVQTLNSPFNTCEEIPTDDLNLTQAEELFNKVSEKNDKELVGTIFDLVGGNPYLLQTVFDKVYLAKDNEKEASLNKAFEYLYSGQDNHFQYLFQRVAEDENLKELASELANNSSIVNDPADVNSKFLRTLGLAKLDGKNLIFRNKLYKDFAENTALLDNRNYSSDTSSHPAFSIDKFVMGDYKDMKKTSVSISKSTIGGNVVVSEDIKNSFNTITSSDTSDEIKSILLQLGNAVDKMAKVLPQKEAEESIEDFKRLADEAVKESPKPKWYSVSIDGLQKAAKNLGEIGKPVLELTAQLINLLGQLAA